MLFRNSDIGSCSLSYWGGIWSSAYEMMSVGRQNADVLCPKDTNTHMDLIKDSSLLLLETESLPARSTQFPLLVLNSGLLAV